MRELISTLKKKKKKAKAGNELPNILLKSSHARKKPPPPSCCLVKKSVKKTVPSEEVASSSMINPYVHVSEGVRAGHPLQVIGKPLELGVEWDVMYRDLMTLFFSYRGQT